MANISQYIAAINAAARGEEVRDSITGALTAINADIPVQVAAALEAAKQSGDFDGTGISSITLNSDYTLTINLDDGTSYTTTSIRGETGATGSQGPQGVSPTVTITSITGGHRVTITDEDHPSGQSFDVLDGTIAPENLDEYPVADSTNAVQSGGLYTEFMYKRDIGGVPDWNEDETSMQGYIKNRTHYEAKQWGSTVMTRTIPVPSTSSQYITYQSMKYYLVSQTALDMELDTGTYKVAFDYMAAWEGDSVKRESSWGGSYTTTYWLYATTIGIVICTEKTTWQGETTVQYSQRVYARELTSAGRITVKPLTSSSVVKLPTKYLDMDSTPTSGSTKPVTSGGIYTALDGIDTAVTGLSTKVGDLTELTTTDKSDLVSAINEVDGDVADLNTALTQIDQSKADIIISSASGDIASFADGADDLPVEDLTVGIEPVQDLHGYDHPWAPGGGANQWDEEWEVGSISFEDGQNTGSSANIRSKNYISVVSGATYYYKSTETAGVRYYDANHEFLSAASLTANTAFVIPTGVSYMRFVVLSGYGTTYKNDISVNYPATVTTYSPYSNICPITGHIGMTVNRTGFNVWDEEWEAGGINDTTGASEPGYNNSQGRSKNYIPVLSGKTYFVRVGDVGDTDYTTDTKPQIWAYAYDANKNFIGRIYRDGTTSTRLKNSVVTMPQGCCFIRFKWWYSGAAVLETYNHDISINYPANDTGYHPYSGTSIPIDWTTEAGTVYGGSLDVTTGVLTVDRAMVTFDGSSDENWEYSSGWTHTNTAAFYADPIANAKFANGSDVYVQCNLFQPLSRDEMAMNDVNGACFSGDYNEKACPTIRISKSIASDLASFLTWIGNNNVVFVYYLNTNQTYQLTPQEVKTLLGQNNIWADTGDSSVTYRADTKLYVDGKVDDVRQDLSLIAPIENGSTASQAYTTGQYFLKDNQFCKALTSIASGATFTLNTNYAVTTVAAELYTALNS